MRRNLLIAAILISLVFTIGAGVIIPNSIAEDSEKNPTMIQKSISNPKYYYDSETGIYKVKAGGGGARIVAMAYYPSILEIKVGDTVQWYNPTKALEPHTVTFIADSKYTPLLEGPFSIVDPSTVAPLPGDLNSEPVIVPLGVGEEKAIIAANARVFFPFVVDSDGNATNLGINANYVSDGSEKYINSGWLVPKEFGDLIQGTSDSFTVKFEEQGTFQYICILHPWMAGQVKVTN